MPLHIPIKHSKDQYRIVDDGVEGVEGMDDAAEVVIEERLIEVVCTRTPRHVLVWRQLSEADD